MALEYSNSKFMTLTLGLFCELLVKCILTDSKMSNRKSTYHPTSALRYTPFMTYIKSYMFGHLSAIVSVLL